MKNVVNLCKNSKAYPATRDMVLDFSWQQIGYQLTGIYKDLLLTIWSLIMNKVACLPSRFLDILVCPKCHGVLETRVHDVQCQSCFNIYPVKNNIIFFIDKNQFK